MAWFNLQMQKTRDVLVRFDGNAGETDVGTAYIVLVRFLVFFRDD